MTKVNREDVVGSEVKAEPQPKRIVLIPRCSADWCAYCSELIREETRSRVYLCDKTGRLIVLVPCVMGNEFPDFCPLAKAE